MRMVGLFTGGITVRSGQSKCLTAGSFSLGMVPSARCLPDNKPEWGPSGSLGASAPAQVIESDLPRPVTAFPYAGYPFLVGPRVRPLFYGFPVQVGLLGEVTGRSGFSSLVGRFVADVGQSGTNDT